MSFHKVHFVYTNLIVIVKVDNVTDMNFEEKMYGLHLTVITSHI